MTKASDAKYDAKSGLPVSQIAMVGLGLIAVVLPFIGWRSFSLPSSPSVDLSGAAQVVLPERVSALGRIEPVDGVITVGAPINEIVSDLVVVEGDWVEAGDVVAYLRSAAERLAEFDRAEQALAAAVAQLEADARYANAQAAEANTDYENLPAVQSEGLAAQQAVVDSLGRELDFARQELSRYDMLYRQGALSQNDIEQRRIVVAQKEEQLRQESALLQQRMASRDREIANARAELDTARVATDRAIAQSQVETARRDRALAEVRVENALIRAPISGRVLRTMTRSGETVSDNGRGKGAIFDMADTRQMVAIAEVYEANIHQIRKGQSAVITSRNGAFDSELTGKVIAIGNQIFKKDVLNDDPTARVDARVVEVKVLLDNPSAMAGFTNLQVDVDIEIATPVLRTSPSAPSKAPAP